MPRELRLSPGFALLLACNPDEPEGTSATESSSGTSSGGSVTSAPTSSATETDGSATGTGATETGATTDADTDADSTGAPPGSDPQAVCEAFCARGPMCGLRPGGEACVDACVTEANASMGPCREARLATLACYNDMTCEEFLALLEMDQGPCARAFPPRRGYGRLQNVLVAGRDGAALEEAHAHLARARACVGLDRVAGRSVLVAGASVSVPSIPRSTQASGSDAPSKRIRAARRAPRRTGRSDYRTPGLPARRSAPPMRSEGMGP